jgi:hypothetical protein
MYKLGQSVLGSVLGKKRANLIIFRKSCNKAQWNGMNKPHSSTTILRNSSSWCIAQMDLIARAQDNSQKMHNSQNKDIPSPHPRSEQISVLSQMVGMLPGRNCPSNVNVNILDCYWQWFTCYRILISDRECDSLHPSTSHHYLGCLITVSHQPLHLMTDNCTYLLHHRLTAGCIALKIWF